MSEGTRYAVVSLGVLLILFGAFLALWRRSDHPRAAVRNRTGVWVILAAGAGLVTLGLLASSQPAPPVPDFLRK